MEETSEKIIQEIVDNQKKFFSTNTTKDVTFRIKQLKKLKAALALYKDRLESALWEDLHKSPEEAYLTEYSILSNELNYHIKHLRRWAKPKKVKTPLHLKPSSSKIMYEPYGLSLIIAPWNYPLQLLIAPLIGAISAGCCAMLKPSPDAPQTARVMQEMIEETFDSKYIAIVQGGRETNTILLHERFDMMFFTGSSRVGKVVMEAAAKRLVPVVLELGGKSPCIVDKDANLKIAAKRITWGKFINAGQTCIAPDYLFVHRDIKDELIKNIIQNIEEMYGDNIKSSRFYPRIVTHDAVDRLSSYLKEGEIIYGGDVDYDDKFISPTIIDKVNSDDAIMQDEIFGPLLPILTFEHVSEATEFIVEREKPLALYYFGKNNKAKDILNNTTSGGACINDTLMHITNHHLPFGGVGYSGIGKYHGKDSFLAFSNRRSIVTTPTWIDLPLKYVPFKHFNIIKKVI